MTFKFSSLVIKSHQEKYVTKTIIWCVKYSFVIMFDRTGGHFVYACVNMGC